MSMGENIKALREAHNLSQAELGAIAGVSHKAVSTWENNIKTPRMGAIQKMADYFRISKSTIIEGRIEYINSMWAEPLVAAYEHATTPRQEAACAALSIPHIVPHTKPRRKPISMVVYTDQAAAGLPLYAESDFERLDFPEDEVPDDADFGIRISGDSMEPTIADGSIVWVKKTPEIGDGQVAIIMLADCAVCKRVRLSGSGRLLRLESDNEKYAPIKGGDLSEARCVGRVLL